MKNKIVAQIQDCLRGSSLAVEDALILALQMLAWMKLSRSSHISEKFYLNPAVLTDPSKAASIMWELNNVDDSLIKQAFAGDRYLRVEPKFMIPALDMVLRLAETGVLQHFDLADGIELPPGSPNSESTLPTEVVELLIGLAGIQAGQTVYVPWDSRAQLACRLTAMGAEAYLEHPQSSPIPALVSLLCDKPFEVHCADPVKSPSAIDGGRPRKFDVIVSFPPIGQRYDTSVIDQDWFSRFPERTPSGAVLTLRHMLSQAKRKVVVAVPNNFLFSPGAERQLREFLLEKGILQAVIAMPSGLLSWANIPFTVLVLDTSSVHENIQFINADAPAYKTSLSKAKYKLKNVSKLIALASGNAKSNDAADIARQEVFSNDMQLQASRYVLPESQKKLQDMLAKHEKVALGDVVKIIRPMQPSKPSEEETIDVQEVGAADLPQYGYITSASRTLKVDGNIATRNEHQFLKPYDIVLIIKGSVGKVGIVPPNIPTPGEYGWIASQSATILRCVSPSRIDARTLFMQLRSPLGRELINGIVSGGTIQLIQLRELNRLAVLIPDQKIVQLSVGALEKEAELQRAIDKLIDDQEKASDELWAIS